MSMTASTGSTYQQIIDSLVQPPQAYIPNFRIVRDRWGWQVLDDKTPIAHIKCEGDFAFDIWQFSPFASPIIANVNPPNAVYDLHTVHNTYVNLPFTWISELVKGVEDPFARMRMEWCSQSGVELHLRITGEFLHSQRIQYDIRFTYDPQRAQYRFSFDAEVWQIQPYGGEPINMMLAGALADIKEKRRWSHSIWVDPEDQLKRLVHSNALFFATDYADYRWRTKNAPQHGAWVAYAAHPEFNPAMLVHETNVPIHFATCSQLFDEHLIWQQAGLEELDEGYFHFVMRTELVNLPPALAQEFLTEATDPPQPTHWQMEKVALPFHMAMVNSFEEHVNPWAPEECPIFVLNDPTVWADDAAHSGTRSLKLVGESLAKWTTLFPVGAICQVESHARYRLSGWIKTAGVERFARLELASFEYGYGNLIDTAHTAHITGDCDWAYVEAELDTEEEAYVMPRLSLYGRGTVWFDDLKLEQIA
ncbi:MAG: hypothetical protein ACYDBB_08920 [Armatimonadota bacterium]